MLLASVGEILECKWWGWGSKGSVSGGRGVQGQCKWGKGGPGAV